MTQPRLIPLSEFFDNSECALAKPSPDGTMLSWVAPLDGHPKVWVRPIGGVDKVPVTRVQGYRLGEPASTTFPSDVVQRRYSLAG